MIDIDIPDYGRASISHVVLDYNGTLAVDGRLIEGVAAALNRLADVVEIHVLTADTFGIARDELKGVRCTLSILPKDDQAEAKLRHLKGLGASGCLAVGNGRNDRKMLKAARIGVAVVQREGAASKAVAAADIVSPGILDALALLENPKRLIATLRS